jgi:hypothetical protein
MTQIRMMAFNMSGRTPILAFFTAITNGEALTSVPPRRLGSVYGTRIVMTTTVTT